MRLGRRRKTNVWTRSIPRHGKRADRQTAAQRLRVTSGRLDESNPWISGNPGFQLAASTKTKNPAACRDGVLEAFSSDIRHQAGRSYGINPIFNSIDVCGGP
jgi:hypothetical protein